MNITDRLKSLAIDSKQRISIWSNDFRRWTILETLFLGVNPNEYADSGESADFLHGVIRQKAVLGEPDSYNFVIYSETPEKIELREGVWVLSWSAGVDRIFPDYRQYEKYLGKARAGRLI